MSNSMEYIVLKETLIQSEFAGNQYKELFNQENISFTNPLVEEVEEIYNQIVKQYDELTEYQLTVLARIIDKLNDVRIIVDPNRLKDFKNSITDDGDLLLFRENETGLINIIIHPEDDFAYSFIGNIEGRNLDFYDLETADFESIVLNFLSK